MILLKALADMVELLSKQLDLDDRVVRVNFFFSPSLGCVSGSSVQLPFIFFFFLCFAFTFSFQLHKSLIQHIAQVEEENESKEGEGKKSLSKIVASFSEEKKRKKEAGELPTDQGPPPSSSQTRVRLLSKVSKAIGKKESDRILSFSSSFFSPLSSLLSSLFFPFFPSLSHTAISKRLFSFTSSPGNERKYFWQISRGLSIYFQKESLSQKGDHGHSGRTFRRFAIKKANPHCRAKEIGSDSSY